MEKMVLRKAFALLLCAALCAGLMPPAFADAYSAQYPLPAPSLGSAEYYNGEVRLNWNRVLNATRYGIFRSTNGGPWKGLAVVVNTSYRDEAVEPGETYAYTVCCVSSDGRSLLSPYNETGMSVTIPVGGYTVNQLPAPVLLDASNVAGGVLVSWASVSGASKYGIFRKTEDGPWKGLAVCLNTSYKDETVESGVNYTYTVCCLTGDGKAFQSPYDETGIAIKAGAGAPSAAQLQTPTLLDVGNVGHGLRVSWLPVSGAPQYGIFRKTEDGPWKGLAVVQETSFTDDGVEPGVNYTYTVCCVSADGRSLLSPYDETGISVKANSFTGGASAFSIQPKDQGAKQMTYASFTAKARDSQVHYQWEMRAKGSDEWYVLPEIAWLIGGVNTGTLIIAAVLGLDGYNFRCLISDGQYAEYSNTVTLYVVP